MKSQKENKKSLELCGSLLCPLVTGQCAVFKAGGDIYRTSTVKAIHEVTADRIHFETENTHYHLFLSPYPAAVICQFPLEPAACA
nr:hypothetical protein [uncultured Acetatifactor sp.]